MATEYSQRPSELIELDDPFASYCFDEACSIWGHYVENKVREAGKRVKDDRARHQLQIHTLKMLLAGEGAKREEQGITNPYAKHPEAAPPIPGKYRDPATFLK